jgi:hypothetical protein
MPTIPQSLQHLPPTNIPLLPLQQQQQLARCHSPGLLTQSQMHQECGQLLLPAAVHVCQLRLEHLSLACLTLQESAAWHQQYWLPLLLFAAQVPLRVMLPLLLLLLLLLAVDAVLLAAEVLWRMMHQLLLLLLLAAQTLPSQLAHVPLPLLLAAYLSTAHRQLVTAAAAGHHCPLHQKQLRLLPQQFQPRLSGLLLLLLHLLLFLLFLLLLLRRLHLLNLLLHPLLLHLRWLLLPVLPRMQRHVKPAALQVRHCHCCCCYHWYPAAAAAASAGLQVACLTANLEAPAAAHLAAHQLQQQQQLDVHLAVVLLPPPAVEPHYPAAAAAAPHHLNRWQQQQRQQFVPLAAVLLLQCWPCA